MTPQIINAFYLLISTYSLVFCLGLQSLLVNNNHKVSAFVNSFAIGAANVVLFKLVPTAGFIEIAAYLAGGPLGIVSSMLFYRSAPVQSFISNKSFFSTKE